LALNQFFILVNITLISFIDSEGFGLVTIKLVSPRNKISLVLLLLAMLLVQFGKSLM